MFSEQREIHQQSEKRRGLETAQQSKGTKKNRELRRIGWEVGNFPECPATTPEGWHRLDVDFQGKYVTLKTSIPCLGFS